MDLIIFSGQSNMQGSSGEKGFSIAEECFEYKFLTDEFVTVKDPVGEDLGEDLLCASANGGGSLVPAFCNAYAKKKQAVVAVHVAKGGTTIEEWKKGTDRYSALIKKCQNAICKVREFFGIDKIYFVWLQGESNAVIRTPGDEYLTALIDFKNSIKTDLGIDKFGIIRVGYFAEYAWWDIRSTKIHDEIIMDAQERAVKVDSDFVMLTRVCAELSVKEEFLNPQENGPHYNNHALDIIGKAAGLALAEI